MYKIRYITPKEYDQIIIESDGEYLTGLTFELEEEKELFKEIDLPIFKSTIKWLDMYFKEEIPNFIPKIKLENLTPFQTLVATLIKDIPYGESITYNDLAKKIAKIKNIQKMSAQAVGGALGKNPICIIIPCHRVIGTSKKIIGYSAGILNKKALLKHEKIFFIEEE